MSGITLDAGALIGIDRADREVLTLLGQAMAKGIIITVPSTAFAQVVRDPSKQVALMRLFRYPGTKYAALDRAEAIAVGMLLRNSRTRDIVDAHVVVCALKRGDIVLTSDPGDLQRLAPELPLIAV